MSKKLNEYPIFAKIKRTGDLTDEQLSILLETSDKTIWRVNNGVYRVLPNKILSNIADKQLITDLTEDEIMTAYKEHREHLEKALLNKFVKGVV